MMTMHIEQATTEEEIQTIADLAEIIWHQHFTPIIGKEQVIYMVEKFQSFNALKEQIENGYEYYRIFDQDGKLFLSKLYLKKEARGKHLATNVFEFLKQLCRERGLSAIWLTCNKHNDNSLAVYRHLGFETVDTQVADIGNGFVMDDYIMEVTV